MAPRKRTTTEKPEAPPSLDSKVEVKPKKVPAKKAVKAGAKPAPAKAAEPLPEAAPATRKKAGRPSKQVDPKAQVVEETKPVATEAIARPSITPAALTPHAQKVMEAIAEGRAIELVFQDGDSNPPRTFEPRQLIFEVFTGSWFAWGWDRRYNAERHHCLDLLAEINAVEGMGRSAQGPYPEGTPANQIGGWRGGEAIPVKAVLQKQWIFAVKQSPAPFPDFRLEDIEEGKAQVSFVGTDLRAIARWCMQFGDGIQVLEPQRLVDRIKQVGISWAGKAAQALTPQPPAKAQHPKPEPRHEPRPEPRHEVRPEPRHEARRPEAPRKEYRESREAKESDAPKAKPARVEVRIERL
jgi:predicted DNA-binding transcriptional regulator YafY